MSLGNLPMHESIMEQLWSTSQFAGSHSSYLEQMYEAWLEDPNSVPEDWRLEFEKLPQVQEGVHTDVPHSPIREYFGNLVKSGVQFAPDQAASSEITEHERKQVKVLQLVTAYRVRGHQAASLDPLNLWQRERPKDLNPAFHGLTKADEALTFNTGTLFFGKEEMTLKEIIDSLGQTYCNTIGAEFAHITDTSERRWLQQKLESTRSKPEYNKETRTHILERLIAAEGMEKYLGSRFAGAKRFGLEGGESLIPMIDELVQRAGEYGIKESVIGMAHRGRLNVLVNILGKNPADLFSEFEGKSFIETGSGDVKYHQGFSSNVHTKTGEMHLAMAFNPSHLEIVAPVVEGSVRARQDRRGEDGDQKVLPIVLHGDAAFCGQGVVMETFQMSQTRGYGTGGTIHIVVNNQVGFTTNAREDVRSTEYSTDVAKMIQAPIIHVNGDDPEAVILATKIAVDYRMEFGQDIVLDLFCYRRRGHNEADEPSGTQPLMYSIIRKQKTTVDLYSKALVDAGVLSTDEYKAMVADYRAALDNGQHVAKSLVSEPNKELFVDWTPYINQPVVDEFDTSLPVAYLQELAHRMNQIPEGFAVQRQVQKIYDDREKMAGGGMALNWGMAETLAYASILDKGQPIRFTGQDVGRGTFSHRHAVLHDQKDESLYTPLKKLSAEQGALTIHDSYLSEEAVLAFEYGYATTMPSALVIWEAQFGDFANGAQVVIDQFITSGENKWGRLCGLTMLLPHGYEGQGPEHSSARLERYLQLCAEHNIQVCMPTTPAQIYHLLRRQAVRNLRKPLVVLTPKSLLRHKDAISSLDDLASGTFNTVIPEVDTSIDNENIQRVILCSGRVYYDLVDKRTALEKENLAIVRIEQLYPFPEDVLEETLKQYPNLQDVVWCQEEPMNQGAWYCSQHHMRRVVSRINPDIYLSYTGREASASVAAGYMSLHLEQLESFLNDALTYPKQ